MSTTVRAAGGAWSSATPSSCSGGMAWFLQGVAVMMHCFISQRQAPHHGAHACTATLSTTLTKPAAAAPFRPARSVCPPQPPRPQPLPAWQRARAVNASRHARSYATTNVLTYMQRGCLRPSYALLISCSGPLLRPCRCASCVSCTPHRSFVIPLLSIHLICPRSKFDAVAFLLCKPACRPLAARALATSTSCCQGDSA